MVTLSPWEHCADGSARPCWRASRFSLLAAAPAVPAITAEEKAAAEKEMAKAKEALKAMTADANVKK